MNINIFILLSFAIGIEAICDQSITSVSGTDAPSQFCSGDLIFEENFDNLDQSKWRHAMTMSGGLDNEFQWYVNDRFNSYAAEGIFHIRPSFTTAIVDEEFLRSGHIALSSEVCTDSYNYGCERTGNTDVIINPIRSARIDTLNSFAFKFGTIEFRAKMPAGDWLLPALSLLPKDSIYGQWPASGEIDVMEMRGNRALFDGLVHVGNEQAACTLQFGPTSFLRSVGPMSHFKRNQSPGFNEDFHLYKVIWNPTEIIFYIDNEHVGTVNAGDGFWNIGEFGSSEFPNPWTQGTIMAPFDQEFYIVINLAVGGSSFPDSFNNVGAPKPWQNGSPRAVTDFWEERDGWDPTWNRNSLESHLQVDYVRVWAL